VTFLLNDEYLHTKHIYGALCKFLRLSSTHRIASDLLHVTESGHTRVSFYLADTAACHDAPDTAAPPEMVNPRLITI
jgi:hypothetical protein